eukprot:5970071-Amphidinium_carterae.2
MKLSDEPKHAEWQRLEQLEASAVEVKVMVSRERDSHHNELMRTLESTVAQGSVAPPPTPPTQASAVPQTQPVPSVVDGNRSPNL